ncbi:hypothetical protein YC2023_105406 [Brassica napus]
MNRYEKPPWPGDYRRLAHKLKLELRIWIQGIALKDMDSRYCSWIQGIALKDMADIRYDNDDFVRTIVLVCGGPIWQQGSIQNCVSYYLKTSFRKNKTGRSGNCQDEGNSILKRRPTVTLQHQHNVQYFSYCVCRFQIGRKPRSRRVKENQDHLRCVSIISYSLA